MPETAASGPRVEGAGKTRQQNGAGSTEAGGRETEPVRVRRFGTRTNMNKRPRVLEKGRKEWGTKSEMRLCNPEK